MADVESAAAVAYDVRDPDAAFPPIGPLRRPPGVPNVLIELLDDVGFGASSVFRGPAETPTGEQLAAEGPRHTRFHTTALCSPTRAALLPGRNHHAVGMGVITRSRRRLRAADLTPAECAKSGWSDRWHDEGSRRDADSH